MTLTEFRPQKRSLNKLGPYLRNMNIISPKPRRLYGVTRWIERNSEIWAKGGLEPVPIDDHIDDYDQACYFSEDEVLQPISLEAIPPFPKQNAEDTLFGTQNLRRQPRQGSRQPNYIEIFDDQPDYAPYPGLESPAGYISTASSFDNSFGASDNEWPRIAGRAITKRVRKVVSKSTDICRTLKKKLER